MLTITKTELSGVLILDYALQEDQRGSRQMTFSARLWEEAGFGTPFAEEYLYTAEKKGTLYGIHFQNHPKAQTKLVYCIRGKGRDYVVDLRRESPAFKTWISVDLDGERRRQVYVPPGFGHAFLSLEDHTQLMFRVDREFDRTFSRTISYKDTELNIPFPVADPILSPWDRNAPPLRESDCNF